MESAPGALIHWLEPKVGVGEAGSESRWARRGRQPILPERGARVGLLGRRGAARGAAVGRARGRLGGLPGLDIAMRREGLGSTVSRKGGIAVAKEQHELSLLP